MGKCNICGRKILELDSNRCIGHACEKRLCIPCFSAQFGYCKRCKILREIEADRVQGNYDEEEDSWDKYWEDYD